MTRDPCQTDSLPPLLSAAALPAWFLSLAIHLLLAVTASLAIRATAPTNPSDEPPRSAEIVLVQRNETTTKYFTDDDKNDRQHVPGSIGSANPTSGAPGNSGPAPDQPPLLAGIALPERPGNIAVAEGLVAAPSISGPRAKARIPSSPLDEAAILAEDALIPREKLPTGPTAELSLFGSQKAVGRSFVFVIDRSTSMGGEGLGAIEAAAKELRKRLDALTDKQSFQVVAYNQDATYLTQRELIPATAENKRKLIDFIATLTAFGQTEHFRGITAALRAKPEVIFLLTDGGDPPLNSAQLKLLRDEAAGSTQIHCLHFGRGPQSEPKKFLARLAADNFGAYIYIDMNGR